MILQGNKKFEENEDIENDILVSKSYVENLGLPVGNNIFLLCYALESTKNVDGCYLECGVFRGSTILAAQKFCEIRKINKIFFGADSFEGFPKNQTSNINDLPQAFENLKKEKKITQEHYDAAVKRVQTLNQKNHLQSEYFSEPGNLIFEHAKNKNINLIKGPFKETLPFFNHKIAVLHLDCDLYEPYLECLKLQYSNVIKGGIVVLDEYYSLKYPGARIAVDEFLSTLSKDEYELLKFNTENFERWCIIKL
jgi:hypothetical protein